MRNKIMCATVLLVVVFTGSVLADWTTPVPVSSINTTYYEEWTPFLSNDNLTIYYTQLRNLSPSSPAKIYAATRSSPTGQFGAATQVLDASGSSPWVSQDGLRMYYTGVYSLGGGTAWNLKYSQRASANDSWSDGSWISEIKAFGPYIANASFTTDELTIVFSANMGNPDSGSTADFYTASRPDKNSAFTNIRELTEISTSLTEEQASFISPDGLSVVFSSDRDHQGNFSLYTAARQSLSDSFGNIQHLSIFDTSGYGSKQPFMTADGSALYYLQDHGLSSRDIYVSYNVPEPATIILLGLGGILLRRSKK